VSRTTTLLLTLQAFDAADRYLNSQQFAAHIQANMFVDPADGAIYGAVRVGRQFWMATNLAREPGTGSFPSQGGGGENGRGYTAPAAAIPGSSEGWRLPSLADWTALIKTFADSHAAYAALIAGGSTGFDALLGGFCDANGTFTNFGVSGLYWTATPGAS